MSPGKLAAQTAHASLSAYDIASKAHIDVWKKTGTTKVVLAGWSEQELMELYQKAISRYLPTSLIIDEGRTEVTVGTITGMGIGPAPVEKIDEVTGHLKLYGKDVASDAS